MLHAGFDRVVVNRFFIKEAAIGLVLGVAIISESCRHTQNETIVSSYNFPDTVRVGTLYSPMSYFQYRDQEMGYDYALIKQLAENKGAILDLHIAPSVNAMISLLDSGMIDIAAYDMPLTGETLEKIVPCGYEHVTTQVLVQKKGHEKLTDVTELIGKDVYVEKDSKYYYRIINLNDELGGGINIHVVEEDSIIAEDLLERVSDGTIAYSIVDSEVARFNRSYYPDLDISLELSFPQRSSWAVSRSNPWLADSINQWFVSSSPEESNRHLLRRYFELSRSQHIDMKSFTRNFGKGYISEYDELFKRYSVGLNLDWKLLAAISYAESRFDNDVISWAGAKGLMQIMPSTAKAFGIDPSALIVPSTNIELATKILNSLDSSLRSFVPDNVERKKFVIGAYNSGLAHVLDAISIAKEYGLDAGKWDGNVAEALKMKSHPDVYNNIEICRFGYFKGSYTVAYVKSVMELYGKALSGIS